METPQTDLPTKSPSSPTETAAAHESDQRPKAVVSCGGSPTLAKLKSQYMESRDKFLSSEDASERPKLFLDLCNIMLAIVDASLFGERSENIER